MIIHSTYCNIFLSFVCCSFSRKGSHSYSIFSLFSCIEFDIINNSIFGLLIDVDFDLEYFTMLAYINIRIYTALEPSPTLHHCMLYVFNKAPRIRFLHFNAKPKAINFAAVTNQLNSNIIALYNATIFNYTSICILAVCVCIICFIYLYYTIYGIESQQSKLIVYTHIIFKI